MTGAWAIGVDIGGTKIAAGAVDAGGRVRTRAARPTPRRSAADVLDAVVDLVGEVRAANDGPPAYGVGVGTGGMVDTAGTVTSATDLLPGWAGTPIGARLADRLGAPVAVAGDAHAHALGEQRFGAGRPYREVLYAAVGTGVGGAVVTSGRLWRGPGSMTGRLAHLPVADGTGPAGDRPCGCGRTGHLEAVASGPAMTGRYRERSGEHVADLRDVASRAAGGDRVAAAVIRDGARALGRALAGLAAVLDPEAIVVGGGVPLIGAAYWDPLAAALGAEASAIGPAPRLHRARLGADSGLAGAAALVLPEPRS